MGFLSPEAGSAGRGGGRGAECGLLSGMLVGGGISK